MRYYLLLNDRVLGGVPQAAKGDLVYDCKGWDYGCANDDTRAFGVEHRSVTLSPTGDYPFFTVPVSDLERVDLSDEALGIGRNASDEIVSIGGQPA